MGKIDNPELAAKELLILGRLRTVQDHMRQTELITIKSLMMKGVSLAKIGEPMGLSRQALRRRLISGYYGEAVSTKKISG